MKEHWRPTGGLRSSPHPPPPGCTGRWEGEASGPTRLCVEYTGCLLRIPIVGDVLLFLTWRLSQTVTVTVTFDCCNRGYVVLGLSNSRCSGICIPANVFNIILDGSMVKHRTCPMGQLGTATRARFPSGA